MQGTSFAFIPVMIPIVAGKGVAAMWKAPAMPPNAGSSAWVELAEDGKVNVGIGGQDLGQGSFTISAQMAAATLGDPASDEIAKTAKPTLLAALVTALVLAFSRAFWLNR